MSRIKLPKRLPAAQPTPPEEPRLANTDLEEELEIVCLDAMRGDAPGQALEARLIGVCRQVLDRYGHQNAKIRAKSDFSGTAIQILLEPGTPQVRTLNLGVTAQ